MSKKLPYTEQEVVELVADRLWREAGRSGRPLTVGAILEHGAGKPAVKKWMGGRPTRCDKCGQPLAGVFIDGRTQMGPWGILCRACHQRCGVGLGTGRGQMYDLVTLEKVGG